MAMTRMLKKNQITSRRASAKAFVRQEDFVPYAGILRHTHVFDAALTHVLYDAQNITEILVA